MKLISQIAESIEKGNYKTKLLPFSKRNSCELYAPKSWEGKKVIIVLLD